MFVKIWMTKSVITIQADQTIGEARALFTEHQIRRLPVLADQQLVGMVGPSDIERFLPSMLDTDGPEELEYLLANTKVSTAMSESLVTTSPDASLVEATVKMRQNKVDGLPVVENGVLVGIISVINVLDAFLEIMTTEKVGTRFDLKIDHKRRSFYKMIKIFRQHRKEIVAIFQHYGFSAESQLVTIQTSDNDNDDLIDELWKEGISVELVTPNVGGK